MEGTNEAQVHSPRMMATLQMVSSSPSMLKKMRCCITEDRAIKAAQTMRMWMTQRQTIRIVAPVVIGNFSSTLFRVSENMWSMHPNGGDDLH